MSKLERAYVYLFILAVTISKIWHKQGMVSVENVTVVSISTYEELKTIIQRGSEQRHTTGTLMNEQSSRSHLIVSVIIESTNLQTQAIARGKVRASHPSTFL